jgi:hypothetical protein
MSMKLQKSLQPSLKKFFTSLDPDPNPLAHLNPATIRIQNVG